jgi:crotonobetainyl-CoA:carnitine CoA-transferase CaiB-like acyl-CoA transferase
VAGVLEGIRVLDFGRYIAGPFCAALLGDLGAEVIRIERIGSSKRERGPGSVLIHRQLARRGVCESSTSDSTEKSS